MARTGKYVELTPYDVGLILGKTGVLVREYGFTPNTYVTVEIGQGRVRVYEEHQPPKE